MNSINSDIPVLTDMVEDVQNQEKMQTQERVSFDITKLPQIEELLVHKITSELSSKIPLMVEQVLNDFLPKSLGAKLQAEILTSLAGALPEAAHRASKDLRIDLVQEITKILDDSLEKNIKNIINIEIEKLQKT